MTPVYECRQLKLNYLLIIDAPLKNSKIGAWLKDAMVVLINGLVKW